MIPTSTDNWFGAPWVGSNIDLLGRNEFDQKLNDRLVPEWRKEGLNYMTLAGNAHAWCSLLTNADFRKIGIKGTNSAAAASWSIWGKLCPYWFGAVLDIEHHTGGRHVCRFLYWIDEKNRLAATLDGNKNNRFDVFATDLSENDGADVVHRGPRWSLEVADGILVSMKDVLAKYPQLKVSGSGAGTQ